VVGQQAEEEKTQAIFDQEGDDGQTQDQQIYQDFADWFEDAEQCPDHVVMEAADLNGVIEEVRELIAGPRSKEADVAGAGALVVGFEETVGGQAKKYFKLCSAHLIQKDPSYIALTSRKNLLYKTKNGTTLNAIGCGFFLQKTAKNEFLAAFIANFLKVTDGTEVQYQNRAFVDNDDFQLEDSQNGRNIAAIKLTLKDTKAPLPDLQDLKFIADNQISDGQLVTISGYAQNTIVEKKVVPTKDKLYAKTDAIKEKCTNHFVTASLASKG
jgi:hypothetical protein